jgi:N-methylhydantoinase A
MRYEGQSFELAVEGAIEGLRAAFEQAHERRYGYREEQGRVELVSIRVSALGMRPGLTLEGAVGERSPRASTRVVFDGEWIEAELWRGELCAGARVEGPALCAMPESTLLVPPGWSGGVDAHGTVVLERAGAHDGRPRLGANAERSS